MIFDKLEICFSHLETRIVLDFRIFTRDINVSKRGGMENENISNYWDCAYYIRCCIFSISGHYIHKERKGIRHWSR